MTSFKDFYIKEKRERHYDDPISIDIVTSHKNITARLQFREIEHNTDVFEYFDKIKDIPNEKYKEVWKELASATSINEEKIEKLYKIAEGFRGIIVKELKNISDETEKKINEVIKKYET